MSKSSNRRRLLKVTRRRKLVDNIDAGLFYRTLWSGCELWSDACLPVLLWTFVFANIGSRSVEVVLQNVNELLVSILRYPGIVEKKSTELD